MRTIYTVVILSWLSSCSNINNNKGMISDVVKRTGSVLKNYSQAATRKSCKPCYEGIQIIEPLIQQIDSKFEIVDDLATRNDLRHEDINSSIYQLLAKLRVYANDRHDVNQLEELQRKIRRYRIINKGIVDICEEQKRNINYVQSCWQNHTGSLGDNEIQKIKDEILTLTGLSATYIQKLRELKTRYENVAGDVVDIMIYHAQAHMIEVLEHAKNKLGSYLEYSKRKRLEKTVSDLHGMLTSSSQTTGIIAISDNQITAVIAQIKRTQNPSSILSSGGLGGQIIQSNFPSSIEYNNDEDEDCIIQ